MATATEMANEISENIFKMFVLGNTYFTHGKTERFHEHPDFTSMANSFRDYLDCMQRKSHFPPSFFFA